MKRTIIIFSLFLAFFTGNLCAQEQKDLEELYLEYFKLPRESLFLHTNKTIYLTNEDIWFKTYAYDRKNNLSSKSTSNIYFGLYDKTGRELAKKLYLARNGAAIGNFFLDSTLPSGEYFLKVSTNWMKNFQEDDSYVQKIQIVNPKYQDKEVKKINTVEYDFQFLPEGGHILVDVKNNVGIKALDDTGKGISASGRILNSKEEEVARFKSNPLGIGKFSFTPIKGEKYTAQITLGNGKEFEQEITNIKNVGVAMSVNNLRKNQTIVTLLLNENSLNLFKGQTFKLLLHKNGKVKTIPVVLDAASKQIAIRTTDLFKGVNILTLFNDQNQPLAERMFFNNTVNIQSNTFFLSEGEKEGDSIVYRLQSNKYLGETVLNASVSVLPSSTKSYDPDHNIVSAIHLKPYLKGTIEKPQYYFKNFDRKKQYELDILLLTQGWSRYSWDRIVNLPPKLSFDFENGISINGFVNEDVQKIYSLFLYPTEWNKSTFINIDKEGKFQLKNFYPQAFEEVKFSYMNKQGTMKRPKMSLSCIKLNGEDNVDTSGYQSFISYYQDKNEISEQFILDDSYEELDEIRLKTDYKEKLKKETRDPILINGKVTRITEEEVDRYPYITDFIMNNGFDVTIVDGFNDPTNPNGPKLGDVLITARGRGDGATISQGEGSFGAGGANVPTIFMDGQIITDFNVLLNMGMENVERVVVDKTGIGLGLSGGFGGAIKIFTRRGVFVREKKSVNTTYFINVSSYGFQPVKEFYSPKYASYRIQSYKDYGIIHWEPNLSIFGNTSNDLKIFDTGSDEIKFYIEGIGSDGTVFSQVITDNTAKN